MKVGNESCLPKKLISALSATPTRQRRDARHVAFVVLRRVARVEVVASARVPDSEKAPFVTRGHGAIRQDSEAMNGRFIAWKCVEASTRQVPALERTFA